MNEGFFKAVGFRGLRLSGVLALAERRATGVPILAYHGVTERPPSPLDNVRRLHVPATRFEQHLRLLSERWHPVPLSVVRDAVAAGEPLPPRIVAVTFDDGYRNLLTVALPLLRRYGVPATVFVLTGPKPLRLWMDRLESALIRTSQAEVRWDDRVFPLRSQAGRRRAIESLLPILDALGPAREEALGCLCQQLGPPLQEPDDDRDLLSWDQVRSLKEAGLEIGSHADLHEPLTGRNERTVCAALAESLEMLERELGPGPYPFAYPWGAWSPRLAAAVREAGFTCAVTTDPGLNRLGAEPFALRRQLIGADDDTTRLRTGLSGLRTLWGYR